MKTHRLLLNSMQVRQLCSRFLITDEVAELAGLVGIIDLFPELVQLRWVLDEEIQYCSKCDSCGVATGEDLYTVSLLSNTLHKLAITHWCLDEQPHHECSSSAGRKP